MPSTGVTLCRARVPAQWLVYRLQTPSWVSMAAGGPLHGEGSGRGVCPTHTSLFPCRWHMGGPHPAHRGHQVRAPWQCGAGGWQWQRGHLEPSSALLSNPRLDLSDIPNSVRLVAPDVGILLVSSLCLCVCHRLVPKASADAHSRGPETLESLEQVRANPGTIGTVPPSLVTSPSPPQEGQPGTRGAWRGDTRGGWGPGWEQFQPLS